MDDDLLDYWDIEVENSENDIWVSIYALPIVAVVVISLVLIVVLAIALRSRPEEGSLTTLNDVSENSVHAENAPPDIQLDQPAARASSTMAVFFSPSVLYWEEDILKWAAEWQLDPNLVATVMQIESCGHPDVVSSAGAMGLFQVMPFHFKEGEATFDPEINASRGLSYLTRSLDAHERDVFLALAGYNGGITGSQRAQSAWPAETKRYTYWGIGIFNDAAEKHTSSARLEEWLASGGAGLCRRAEAHLGLNP